MCLKCNFFFVSFSDVFHEKNQHLAIWFTTAFLLAFLIVCLLVWRRKIAGFLSSYLSLLQGFMDLESGASFICLMKDE